MVAGVPPDAFSETGQRWGNPLYDWDRLAEDGYRWWMDRFRAHAGARGHRPPGPFPGLRGVLGGARQPRNGRSTAPGSPGPARALRAVEAELGRIPMIVEDLGEITPDVIALREALRLPGHEGAPVRLRRRRGACPRAEPVPAAQLRAATASSTPAPTTTTRPSAGSRAWPSGERTGPALPGDRRPGYRLRPDPPGAPVGGRRSRSCRSRICWSLARGADERPRPARSSNWTWRYQREHGPAGHTEWLADLTRLRPARWNPRGA